MSGDAASLKCQFAGDLPTGKERVECGGCGRSCDRGMVLRCRKRGPGPGVEAKAQPCVHLGGIVHHEPCSCGGSKTVAVHACGFKEGSQRSSCIPLARDWDKLVSPDNRHMIANCEACPARQVPVGDIERYGLSDLPLGYHYSIAPALVTGMESRPPREWFERVVCISLDRRPDRWEMFQRHVEQCDWPFVEPERFSAIDGQRVPSPQGWHAGPGAWGCARSHLRLLEDVLSSGAESVLILEDDAQPVEGFAARVREWQSALPDNWQGLWLGGEHVGRSKSLSTRVTPSTIKCRYVTRTHCYGLRQPFLGEFYKYLSDPKTQVENTTQHIDHAIARFMRGGRHALYCPTEWLVAQAAARSDIFDRDEPTRMFR